MEDHRQKVKDQILHVLKMRGSQTAAGLAEALHVSPMAVRQHLQSLQAEGVVTYQAEKRPMGRPVKRWRLTEQAGSRFPDSHADLMVDLLTGIEAVFGAAGLERLMAERSRRQTQHYRDRLACLTPRPDWQAQVRAIAQLRTQEGYMAEVIDQADAALLLVENHCPIYAAAKTCQGLCRAELEMFRTVLGSDVSVERVEHLVQGDRRCAYRVVGKGDRLRP